MKTTTRYCAYCHAPLTGRADKLFCSSSCKSKDFRCQLAGPAFKPAEEEPEKEAPRRASSGSYAPLALREPFSQTQGGRVPAPADEAYEADEENEEFDVDEHLRQVIRRALDERALKQLPLQYSACVEKVLAAHDQCVNNRQLRALRTSIGHALSTYKSQAASRELPADLTQHVTDLYRVEELVEEAWQAHTEHFKPVDFYVKKKLRAHLRTALALIKHP